MNGHRLTVLFPPTVACDQLLGSDNDQDQKINEKLLAEVCREAVEYRIAYSISALPIPARAAYFTVRSWVVGLVAEGGSCD
ncbi:hypothetical protein MIB92_17230 [Aestuariirhabdus sp. Z084]|uniref:hypothetical protein n=1 Tax=Aestuariirhabdus haliotis TaxID=2918751 RepID=UPI00201B3EC2|nr:hypothetical protein [Aestuariirhabdus haliotis]MCL6417406.1 hypothetical protein [Aestuariirhabdus haliotis]MCL6421350.1 hypothetical protein [Aestuariirhabdus haliotis]